jgi:hypothetical protein
MPTCVPCAWATGAPPSSSGGNSGRQSAFLVRQHRRLVGARVDLHRDPVGLGELLVLERMIVAVPVVSCPYMPAALMPMPCCPRDIRRRWNFEP